MSKRVPLFVVCVGVLALAGWLGQAAQDAKPATAWTEVAPGVFRSPGQVAGYALVANDRALLIDAPVPAAGLGRRIDGVLLTHYHRDVCAAVGGLLKTAPVKAPKAAAEWLEPDKVQKYWKESIPLRGSRTAYLVVAEGFKGIDYTLTDGATFDWQGWQLRVLDTPGHALAHAALSARKKDGPH